MNDADTKAMGLARAMGRRCSMCGDDLEGHSFAALGTIPARQEDFATFRKAFYARDWQSMHRSQTAEDANAFVAYAYECPARGRQVLLVHEPADEKESVLIVDRTTLKAHEVEECQALFGDLEWKMF